MPVGALFQPNHLVDSFGRTVTQLFFAVCKYVRRQIVRRPATPKPRMW